MKNITRAIFVHFALFLIISKSPNISFSSTDTKAEIFEYNFPAGIYQVLKYSSSEKVDYSILNEGDIPAIRYYYNASSDGLLEITLQPINGTSPYIELDCNQTWESIGYSYSLKVYEGDSIGLILSPPLKLLYSNITRIGEESYSVFDTWNWPDTAGMIIFNLTPAESLVYDFNWAPVSPKEEQVVTFYSFSNPFASYYWTVDNNTVHSNSSILELQGLSMGNHTVVLHVLDEFENSFTVSRTLSVAPSIVVSKPALLDIFNLQFPETVEIGEPMKITVYLDYILPTEKNIQLKVSESVSNEKKTIITDKLIGNGSMKYDMYIRAPHEVGKHLYYLDYMVLENVWNSFYPKSNIEFEVIESEGTAGEIPSYPLLSIFFGFFIFIKLYNKFKVIF